MSSAHPTTVLPLYNQTSVPRSELLSLEHDDLILEHGAFSPEVKVSSPGQQVSPSEVETPSSGRQPSRSKQQHSS